MKPIIILREVDLSCLCQVSRVGSSDRHDIELIVRANAPYLSCPSNHAVHCWIANVFSGSGWVHAYAPCIVIGLAPVPEECEAGCAVEIGREAGRERVGLSGK